MTDSAPASRLAGLPLRPMAGRRTVTAHLREIVSYRELLGMLVRKELTVRYKNSALGFTWSMLQPLFFLGIYTAVFAILRAGFANFAIWVLCGLLIWNLLSSSLLTATVSITANDALVGKVKFPRAVLPLASVGAAFVHFCMQFVVFCVVLLILRHDVDWRYIWLLPFAVLTMLIVAAACALVLAPANVYARDTMHLLDMAVMGWFWATPILYPFGRTSEFLAEQGLLVQLQYLNPATPVVLTFQRALYGTDRVMSNGEVASLVPFHSPPWYLGILAVTAVVWCVLGLLALRVFDRAETNLAETL